jgi:hypothetical protein
MKLFKVVVKTNFGLMYEQKSISLFANSVVYKYLIKRLSKFFRNSALVMNATLCILVCLAVIAASESSEENLEASRFIFPEFSRFPIPDLRFQIRLSRISGSGWSRFQEMRG